VTAGLSGVCGSERSEAGCSGFPGDAFELVKIILTCALEDGHAVGVVDRDLALPERHRLTVTEVCRRYGISREAYCAEASPLPR
jgi:hypothetical protein